MSRFVPLLFLFILPALLPAWGANGHRIVAKICYDNLSEAARSRVDEALGDNYLEQVSTWPDYIRPESGWDFASPWHYMTVQPDQDVATVATQTAADPDIFDVREAIYLMTDVLRGTEAARRQLQDLMDKNRVEPLAGSLDATALAFLIHFVGDVHQPIHVRKNRDLGGNKITVLYFGERYNLHSVWDTRIIEQERLSYTEFARFVEKHTRSKREKWMASEPEDWMAESIVLRERIYNTLYDETDRDSGLPSFGYDYQHDFLPIVEQRLGAAGYRAAALLNGIYG